MNLHRVELARKYSDRIVGVRDGLAVWEGKPAEATVEILKSIYGDEYAG
jgi:phosphonate transport system ATP-binding protein